MLDLGLVVADKNMDFALRGILMRHQALGIRQITWKTAVLPSHDGGVRSVGPDELNTFRHDRSHGIIMLDYEGSGADSDALALEAELDERVRRTWNDRAKAIVIEPELDIWLWGSNEAMRQVLDCEIPDVREWLHERGYTFGENDKPVRPKEAIQELLFEMKQPRSSVVYKELTSRLTLRRCKDPAFNRLKTTLQQWFPLA